MTSFSKALLDKIESRRSIGHPFLVGIDGRCGAGKTTLAGDIHEKTGFPVLHMDDFFLRPEQRTPERLSRPGENIDHERVLPLLRDLKKGRDVFYAPYDCQKKALLEERAFPHADVILVEGSYSHHPSLAELYDIKVFMDIDPLEQLIRIKKRVGAKRLREFVEKWIPLEEKYFSSFHVLENSDVVFLSSEAIKPIKK